MLFTVWVPHQKEKVLFSAVYRVIWVISTGFYLFSMSKASNKLPILYSENLAEAADKSILSKKPLLTINCVICQQNKSLLNSKSLEMSSPIFKL